VPEHRQAGLEGATRRAAAATDEGLKRVEGGGIRGIVGQLEQAVDEDRAEQLGGVELKSARGV